MLSFKLGMDKGNIKKVLLKSKGINIMKLTIEKIGCVGHADIEIGGLTVLTGVNNSGKSTISKVLYSLTTPMSEIYQNFEKDRNDYVKKVLISLFRDSVSENNDRTSFYSFYKQLQEDITNSKDLLSLLNDYSSRLSLLINNKNRIKLIESKISDTISNLNHIKIEEYKIKTISGLLNLEVYNQLQPVKLIQPGASSISLKDNKQELCNVEINDNKINRMQINYSTTESFASSYYIDDVGVLDDLNNNFNQIDYKSIFNDGPNFPNSVDSLTHFKKLSRSLEEEKENLIENIVNNKAFGNIMLRLSKTINETFIKTKKGYFGEKNHLDIRNLAAGSKVFTILQMLLKNGAVSENSLLILDEPETHLHPQWQNIMAEIIILLVKDFNINIVISTHSPNFLLALECYMIQYEIQKKAHFYQSQRRKDGYLVDYMKVESDNISELYATFAKPFIEMEAFRSKLLEDK